MFAEVRLSSHHLWGEAERIGYEKGKRNETEETSRGKRLGNMYKKENEERNLNRRRKGANGNRMCGEMNQWNHARKGIEKECKQIIDCNNVQ